VTDPWQMPRALAVGTSPKAGLLSRRVASPHTYPEFRITARQCLNGQAKSVVVTIALTFSGASRSTLFAA
jgi:hypothetical protein